MPRKVVELDASAVAEAEAAATWYRERSPTAALAFSAEIDQAVTAISEHPGAWPSYLAGTRRYLLRHFPFSVVYRELEARIQVIAIAHARRRPGYWRRRRRR